ncbi:MAG: DNA polymerase III subunit gamma/tau [Clostridiales Family XIII bacterium]|jgi:DNA polymerase-3 subunit gamma/tau|nr:DNA polymerase III subunit gamma/tau [Clostridiales Family XIII bacterium]
MSASEKYIAIYRRFRPETFDTVLGQEHIIRVLKNQINTGNLGHAYLFTGTRGTGKTTMARLLAKGVNCQAGGGGEVPETADIRPCGVCSACNEIKNGTYIDVVEIDAASNNSVDDVRDLRDSIIYPPAMGRKKVYIIDEVHMFSKGAFNALLKTLEEPPDHVLFILCTTESNKLPQTILSRCIKFDFKRVSQDEIARGMKDICNEMGVSIADDAVALLARSADGSVRDGLSLLEQCVTSGVGGGGSDGGGGSGAGGGEITRDLVLEILGSPSDEDVAGLTADAAAGRTGEALVRLAEMISAGREDRRIIEDWIDYFHSALLIKFVKNPGRIINRSAENIDMIRAQAEDYDVNFINNSIYRLSKLLNDSRWSPHTRILLEMAVIDISEIAGKK